MSVSTWEIIAYVMLLMLGFIFIFVVIVPKYFSKNTGGVVKNPLHRPSPIIIDPKIRGIIADIESKEIYRDGTVSLNLRNRNGTFSKKYYQKDILPFDVTQTMVDADAPVFITREGKYSQSELAEELRLLQVEKDSAIIEKNRIEAEYNNLKSNFDVEVEKAIDKVLQNSTQNKADWEKLNRG